MPSILQHSDYEECLVRFYFGRGDDKLLLCLRRAYEDLKRTLRGIANEEDFPRAGEARRRAGEALNDMLASIRCMNAPSQRNFDDWHRSACERLAAIYGECGYSSFYVGHAQKWLNMSFKYVYVLGERRLPGFGHLYDLCHVPLDNILMDALRAYEFPRLPCAWSRLNDYDSYIDRQRWIRDHFDLAPLDVEFLLWMGRALPQDTV